MLKRKRGFGSRDTDLGVVSCKRVYSWMQFIKFANKIYSFRTSVPEWVADEITARGRYIRPQNSIQ